MNDRTFSKDDWRRFCRELEAAGEFILNSDLVDGPLDIAEGFRYLSRLTRVGLEMHLENANPSLPSFYQASHETAKIGADNPDNVYLNATISGERRYRIWGRRGDAPIFSFGTKANRYAVDGTMASTGELDARDMSFGPNGEFEIFISPNKVDGDWLGLEADSSMVLVRQTFFDRSAERPAEVHIECLDGTAQKSILTADSLARSLDDTSAFVAGAARLFENWAQSFRQDNFNALNTVDQSRFVRAGGDPMIHYLHGWWSLKPNESLKIRTQPPACEGWNFQLNNVWMESLDYRHRRIHINNHTAQPNNDGSISIYVTHTDNDAPNRLDTCGHHHGTMLWRWTGADDHPIPTVEVIRHE